MLLGTIDISSKEEVAVHGMIDWVAWFLSHMALRSLARRQFVEQICQIAV